MNKSPIKIMSDWAVGHIQGILEGMALTLFIELMNRWDTTNWLFIVTRITSAVDWISMVYLGFSIIAGINWLARKVSISRY